MKRLHSGVSFVYLIGCVSGRAARWDNPTVRAAKGGRAISAQLTPTAERLQGGGVRTRAFPFGVQRQGLACAGIAKMKSAHVKESVWATETDGDMS